jgi:hypothetical protein
VALAVSTPALADVNGDLNGFFGSLGYDGNVSKAQAWQGQAAGYMTGALLPAQSGQTGAANLNAGAVPERRLRRD